MCDTLDIHTQIDRILNRLKTLDIYKVILFGSHASDAAEEESDIDLLIVLDTDYLPRTYRERLEMRLSVSRLLRDINKEVPMDLLVYTLPEYNILLEHMNSFFKEIHEHGKTVYEKAG